MVDEWRFVQRHERLVAEVDAWRRQELLKEEMLIQMSKLQAVERQRHHFQGRLPPCLQLVLHFNLEHLHTHTRQNCKKKKNQIIFFTWNQNWRVSSFEAH